jgi:hypothetical protein
LKISLKKLYNVFTSVKCESIHESQFLLEVIEV